MQDPHNVFYDANASSIDPERNNIYKEQHNIYVYAISGVNQHEEPFLIQEYRAHSGLIYNINWFVYARLFYFLFSFSSRISTSAVICKTSRQKKNSSNYEIIALTKFEITLEIALVARGCFHVPEFYSLM